MLIVGQGALARPDGARVLGAARAIAEACGLVRGGLERLQRAASRGGAGRRRSISASCPGAGGKDVAGIVDGCRSGAIEVLYLLGADELDLADTGSAFVIYQGHHGDRGAARADVVLPGCAYTEKDATYVNTEGRVQLGRRAVFPPGEAREDWAIVRALSGALGRPLPFDSLHALRQRMRAAHPHLARIDEIVPAAWGEFGESGEVERGALRLSDRRLLPHRPDQPRQPDNGRVQRDVRRPARNKAADRHAWLSRNHV